MALLNQARLNQYLKLNYNVLLEGLHGVGKTMIVKKTFESAGLRWRYFSASTLDPWVDFVGVPRVIEEDVPATTTPGVITKRRLELIRPGYIENDEVDALFFDELNRAPDKVINAIMELIQFKSINGHKLKNLRVIWAAINPEDEDDTYSVNHLDPAHLDRFQVRLAIPYKVDRDYFQAKYPDTAEHFIGWWDQLPEDIRKLVSPRRLDYAADAYKNGCRIDDFLPHKSNPKQLRGLLQTLPILKTIEKISTQAEANTFLADFNNATRVLEMVKADNLKVLQFFEKYAEFMPKELVAPYREHYLARNSKLNEAKTLDEVVQRLPDDSTDVPNIPSMINDIKVEIVFTGPGDLLNRMKMAIANLVPSKPNVIKKLANRIESVFTTLSVQAISRAMWGMRGPDNNDPTHFHLLAQAVAKAGQFNTTTRDKINVMLQANKIVDRANYL